MGAPYLMHQDYHYFPHQKHTMLAVFLHLDDTTPENGGLAIYPGTRQSQARTVAGSWFDRREGRAVSLCRSREVSVDESRAHIGKER